MREGFNIAGSTTLCEREDDKTMRPITKMGREDYGNRKVREFMRLAEKNLRKKIEHHNLNLNNVHVGSVTATDFEDMDLNADVIDERIEK